MFLVVLFDGFGGFVGLCVLGVYCRVLWAVFFLILLVWIGLCRGCLGVFWFALLAWCLILVCWFAGFVSGFWDLWLGCSVCLGWFVALVCLWVNWGYWFLFLKFVFWIWLVAALARCAAYLWLSCLG